MSRSASGVLIRFGEVFLKKGRKDFFMSQLQGQLERALSRQWPDLKLTRPHGRFLAIPRDEDARIEDAAAVTESLAAVFGVVSAAPCEVVREPTIDKLREAVVAYAQNHRRRRHKTFKIDTRRANKQFPYGSIQCNQILGGAVFNALGDIDVDVHEPDLTIGVEVRQDVALIHGAAVEGVGGLPTGSNGKALLLLSGGIDSPVAGWLTQKRGVAIDAVTFLSPPYTGPQAREKIIELGRLLARAQKALRLWIIPLTSLQERYRDEAPGDQLVLLYRRSMIRIADALAEREGHDALITGESLGQVASQTLPNLHCIGSVATRPVLRPLVAYDKEETIELARKIGTYETSIQPFDDCCQLFVPRHPELRGKPHFLEGIEQRIQPGPDEAKLLEGAETMLLK